MRERELPLSVFPFDCFWMREFNWCDFEWDPRAFPDPEGMLARLKDRGLRICVWINPYIAQRSPLFAEAAAKGYLLTRPDGTVWQWDLWQAGMGIVDFTDPAASAWSTGHLDRLLGMGVDAFKTDVGERIPTDVVWHDGSDPQRMHNYYAHLYDKVVFDLLVERRGEGEPTTGVARAVLGERGGWGHAQQPQVQAPPLDRGAPRARRAACHRRATQRGRPGRVLDRAARARVHQVLPLSGLPADGGARDGARGRVGAGRVVRRRPGGRRPAALAHRLLGVAPPAPTPLTPRG